MINININWLNTLKFFGVLLVRYGTKHVWKVNIRNEFCELCGSIEDLFYLNNSNKQILFAASQFQIRTLNICHLINLLSIFTFNTSFMHRTFQRRKEKKTHSRKKDCTKSAWEHLKIVDCKQFSNDIAPHKQNYLYLISSCSFVFFDRRHLFWWHLS